MSRISGKYKLHLLNISVPAKFANNPREWLENQIVSDDVHWLLAFADDGVITGTSDSQRRLILSCDNDAQIPSLQAVTLQRLHLFTMKQELRIWKVEKGWNGCILADQLGNEDSSLDEEYLLWGTAIDPSLVGKIPAGFTPVVEGVQGQHFILPKVSKTISEKQRASLALRHYIEFNEDGEARIIASRLISFSA